MNYFEFHIADYQRRTAHLSLVEHGAYTLMLQTFYATERPLPSDRKVLYRLLRAESKPERAAVESIIKQFWLAGSDGLSNKRGGEMLAEYRDWVEKQKANGKRGGRPKETHGLANGKPTGGTPILTSHLDHDLDTHTLQTSHGQAAPTGSRPESVWGTFKTADELEAEEAARAGH